MTTLTTSNITVENYTNNIYKTDFSVSSNVNDAVIGFFEKITDNKEAAKALASALLYTSLAQSIDPIETLENFTKLPKNQINAYMAMFLNLNRVGTSLLGVSNAPTTNPYVKRTILA